MKMIRILSLLTGAAISAAVTSSNAQVPVTVNLSFTVLTQGAPHDNGTTTTTRPPTPSLFTTRTLLARLANDLNGGTNFPASAKLVYNGSVFSVEDRAGDVLVPDTSSVLSIQLVSNVFSGTVQDAGTNAAVAPFSVTAHDYVTLKFTESGSGAMSFTATGLGVFTDFATHPNRAGNFHESITARANLAGYGTDSNGNAIVLSGTLVGSGGGTE